MSDDERRHFDNLLLLCLPHHEEVDQLEEEYPVELLEAWKQQQVAGPEGSGIVISDDLVERAVLLSMGDVIMDFRKAELALGGLGGQAPGAGGGGGGAVGPGARGGDGGPGGDHLSATVTGADVMGEVPIVIGKASRPGVLGMPGECGGHTRFGAIVAHGGGREVHTVRSSEVAAISQTSIVGVLLANYAEVQNGLCYLAGAGWDHYRVGELPSPFGAGLCVWVELSWQGADPEIALPIEVIAELLTPTQHVTLSERALFELRDGRPDGFARVPVVLDLRGTLHDEGTHVLHVSCNDDAHVDQLLEVRVAPPGS